MRAFRSIAAAAALLLAGGTLLGLAAMRPQPPAAPAAPASPAPPEAPKFTIADAAFLAGTWRGEIDGSFVEESWSAPQGNNIVGTFRWLRPDGKPAMFEMLAITEEPGGVRLRLRHYSAKLQAKEDADKPLTLRLSQVIADSASSRAVFTAEKDADDLKEVVYFRTGDTFSIDVVFAPESDGTERPPLKFKLNRHVEK